ncbi:MAG: hypothetical protein RL060_100 [Bacteroidota bacterium]
MKKMMLLLMLFAVVNSYAQQLYSTTTGIVSFFSSTPMEDISAVNKKATSIYNATTNELAFQMQIIQFKFPNALMEDHFNENYMETPKYPKASFQGKVNESVDLTKDGVYEVTATGKLTIHGVTQLKTMTGKFTVSKGKIKIESNFEVALADYKIEVPTIVFSKVAEIIKIKVLANYDLKK